MAPGQARVVWQHMAFLGDESRWAAEAAECAGEQGHFWHYHHKLFQESGGRGSGKFAKANLKQYAVDLRLDVAAFGACVDSERYAARVRAETEQARQQGVTRTPTLDVNGQRFDGVPAADVLRAAIQRAATHLPERDHARSPG